MYARTGVILLLLVSTLSCPATAAYPAYGWRFVAGPRGLFAVQQGALDSLDSIDALSQPHNGWQAGAYHVKNQDAWDGDTGFYSTDYRAPLAPGETKTWLIYFWALSGTTPANLGVNWATVSSYPLPSNITAKLESIQKPEGITGGPAVGTVWTTPPYVTLPFYATSNGLNGYGFKFTLTAVPEPSSLLALAGGIAGLGGLALRRKRR